MVERVVAKIGLPNNRLWLDVGFGNGALLMTAKEFGFECAGIEFIKRNVEDIQQFGISAFHGQLSDAVSNNAFDTKPTVISMADVVEHEAFLLESPPLYATAHKLPRNVVNFHAERKRTAVAQHECGQSEPVLDGDQPFPQFYAREFVCRVEENRIQTHSLQHK